MLVQWLTSTFDEQHYLYYMLSKSDMRVIAIQLCTHLLAAGVIKKLEGSDSLFSIFKVRPILLEQGCILSFLVIFVIPSG